MLERLRLLTPAAWFAISACACSGSTHAPAAPTSTTHLAKSAPRDPPEDTPRQREVRDAAYAGKPALSHQTGEATYYARKFEGRRTASGERYDPGARTAAHRTLPFGSVVRVIRVDDPSKVVYVRVNDRGPHGNLKRVIDLSRAAAADLAMLGDGKAMVRLEVVEYGKREERGKHRTRRRRHGKH